MAQHEARIVDSSTGKMASVDSNNNLMVNIGASSGTLTMNLSQVGGVSFALGQNVKANSFSVTMASDQPDIGVNIDKIGNTSITLSTAGADTSSNTVNAMPSVSYGMLYNGATWDRMPGDKTNGTWVNIKTGAVTQGGTWTVGLSAGTQYAGKFRPTDGTNDISMSTAGADASTNTVNTIPTTSYLMGFNSATWDRLQVDGSKNLKVMINNTPSVSQSGTWNVTVNTALPSGTATIGNVGIVPLTSGGLSIYRNINLAATGQNIKGSAGQVYGWYLYNNAASARFIKFYNKATAPTVGTDTPVMTVPLPANSAANVNFEQGIAFGTGIGIGATNLVADNDTTAPSTNDVVVNIFYD